jgi:DNA (cytosine-5)-methyltransferase 1
VVDLFAGGGGASTGLEAALGRPVDLAVNHDPVAIRVHEANHPGTRHLTTDVYDVDPVEATRGAPVDVLWSSPDCRHFSRAKGDVPKSPRVRSLAWVVVRWARAVRPRLIFLENVEEFLTWGPLGRDRRPIQARVGQTFRSWVAQLRCLGYEVDWRVLDASRYGAPTRRRRLFVVARCDGQPIRWPAETHGPGGLPYRTAAECIDWSLPCPSIFERSRPLAEKTLWRIAQGVRRYVLETPAPFVVKVNHGRDLNRSQSLFEPLTTVTGARRGHALAVPHLVDMQRENAPRQLGLPLGVVTTQGNRFNLCAAFLAKHFGGVVGHDLGRPVGTVTARDHHSLAAAHLLKLRGECHGAGLDEPMPTVTALGMHVAEVRAFLTTYYGADKATGGDLRSPTRAITARHRLGLVTVEGLGDFQIVDIGLRMLRPHELLRAQFGDHAEGYDLRLARTQEAQVRLIGNSVCPDAARALVAANVERAAREAVSA